MTEGLRANIDWKSAFSLQQGEFDPKFQVEGSLPPTVFLDIKLGWMFFYAV